MSTAGYSAGIARVDITPQASIRLSGYPNGPHSSQGSAHPLWAKALALDDGGKSRAVIVTTDLIGLPRELTDLVAERVRERHGIERSRILFNSSHTHSGPLVWPILKTMVHLEPREERVAAEYRRQLGQYLFAAIDQALGDLAPARLCFGWGSAHFAANRRERMPDGVRLGVNPIGPVDPLVPVLRIESGTGRLRAIVFGYACHNTAGAIGTDELNGDYAGFAQLDLEHGHPEATAMFLMLCGGDQNPNPHGSVPLAVCHGRTLAREVDRVINTEMTVLRSPLEVAFEAIPLQFAPHTRQTFEDESRCAVAARIRRAKEMLAAYDGSRPAHETSYPIQALRLGESLTILALGGEVVVAYALRLKKEYPGHLIVAGYSNDLMSYIPSRQILREGGYEAVESMVFYGQPGPYAGDVEERVMAGIRAVLKLVGLHPASVGRKTEIADRLDGDV